ncbi:MAG: zinc ribbon domain-containing protein [Ruminococcaceae bacterium]|nr:zinc ribbon domain-containing protein [Oscillospiraceae bacterium]
MNQSHDKSSRNLSVILLILHLFVTFIVNLLTRTHNGNIVILGALGYTTGNSIIVLISFLLLIYQKIQKTGACISIGLQIIASIGMYSSLFAATHDSFFALGFICGIFCNILYIASMVVLLNHNSNLNQSSTEGKQLHTVSFTSKNNSNAQICFCRKCGNKIIEGGKFCNKCGTKTDWRKE